jgi:beta-glucosidase
MAVSNKHGFPSNFIWGSATAAFQVEGAAWTDGRGESIWDRFCRTPGKVVQGHNGDMACDHYNRYKQDIRLMKDLGMQAYRFSTAWPRIIPGGRGAVNKVGLDFYDRLVDELLKADIIPFTTIFHWDLPQPLQDQGGWINRDITGAFSDYAEQVVKRLGDRVKHWMTHNEIPCFIGQSYKDGYHAPGLSVSRKDLNQAYHNAFLTHGIAVRIVREFARKDAEVGLVNNPVIPVPLLDTPAHAEAAQKAFVRIGANLAEPIFKGAYAPWWLEEQGADAPEIRPGDMELISSPTDFVGINIYSGYFVEPSEDAVGYRVLPFPKAFPRMALNWLKPVPQALYWCVRHYREAYGITKSYISETGCACEDEVDAEGRIVDLDRIQWLRSHVQEAQRAVDEGLGLAGYFQWSLMDNFEWAEGYIKRFGIVHVDYETQVRTPKESAYVYREIIRNRGV